MANRIRTVAVFVLGLLVVPVQFAFADAPTMPVELDTLLIVLIPLSVVIAMGVITAIAGPQVVVGYGKRVADAIVRKVRA